MKPSVVLLVVDPRSFDPLIGAVFRPPWSARAAESLEDVCRLTFDEHVRAALVDADMLNVKAVVRTVRARSPRAAIALTAATWSEEHKQLAVTLGVETIDGASREQGLCSLERRVRAEDHAFLRMVESLVTPFELPPVAEHHAVRAFLEQSRNEIAIATGRSENTCKAAIRRVIKEVKKMEPVENLADVGRMLRSAIFHYPALAAWLSANDPDEVRPPGMDPRAEDSPPRGD